MDGGNIPLPDGVPERMPIRMPRKTHPGSRFTLTDRRNASPEKRSGEREEDHKGTFSTLVGLNRTWASYGEMGRAVGVSASKAERIVKGHGHVRDRASGAIVPAA
jgi:hypothetical protein